MTEVSCVKNKKKNKINEIAKYSEVYSLSKSTVSVAGWPPGAGFLIILLMDLVATATDEKWL